jgi:hypothetical protein
MGSIEPSMDKSIINRNGSFVHIVMVLKQYIVIPDIMSAKNLDLKNLGEKQNG